MIVDKALANFEIHESQKVVTLAREGLNTEVSSCCGLLTIEESGQTLQGRIYIIH